MLDKQRKNETTVEQNLHTRAEAGTNDHPLGDSQCGPTAGERNTMQGRRQFGGASSRRDNPQSGCQLSDGRTPGRTGRQSGGTRSEILSTDTAVLLRTIHGNAITNSLRNRFPADFRAACRTLVAAGIADLAGKVSLIEPFSPVSRPGTIAAPASATELPAICSRQRLATHPGSIRMNRRKSPVAFEFRWNY